MGRKGVSVTLFTEADFGRLRSIANVMKLSGCDNVPDWMLTLKNDSGNYLSLGSVVQRRRGNGKIPMKRQSIDTTPKYDKVKKNKRKQYIEYSKKTKKQK